MKRNRYLICFDKITPMAFVFATTRIKFLVFNFLPYRFYLVRYSSDILRRHHYFFLLIHTIFIGFNKIKSGTDGFPVFGRVIINQNFVKNGLSPIVATVRVFVMRGLYFRSSFINITRFVVYYIDAFAVKLYLV